MAPSVRVRCLYLVCGGPITPDYIGGSAVYYEQLMSLAELGVEIHLIHWAFPDARERFDAVVAADPGRWLEVTEHCASTALYELPPHPTIFQRLANRARNTVGPFPIAHPAWRVAVRQLDDAIRSVKPDLVWAQHLTAARVAAWNRQIPIVYSHHDWVYRIKALADRRTPDPRAEAAEIAIARRVDSIVVGSRSDYDELRALGGPDVTYIPLGQSSKPVRLEVPSGPPRLVHLGSLATTANRLGLERFFEVVWPRVKDLGSELWVIGDLDNAAKGLQEHLASVVATGFVPDLETVLRPFDLHVVPWEHSTGQRTRVVNALRFAQVIVATSASVRGIPELVHGENCCLVDDLVGMALVIEELVHDAELRGRLSRNARRTFEASFTREALLGRYADVLNTVTIRA
jgi:glycosyltransferase involved in cell wall biosynthesis